MSLLLTACGIVAAVIGSWRSYAVVRSALGPIVHEGEPTRTAVETAWPVQRRPRVRLFVRRVVTSIAWLAIAMYGLYLASVGSNLS